MGKKGTKKRTQWRTLSITEQDELNAAATAAGTAHISNGNSTTGINIDEASSVDDNFKYSGTNFSYLKRKSSAFSPSSNNYNNNNNNNNNSNSNRNDNFRINSYNTNPSYYYNNKHNSSSINNNNFIAINTTSNASSVNNDTTLNSNNIRYTRSLSSSSRYSSYNNNNNNNSNNNNNLNSNNRRNKPYSMQNGGSSLSSKYYSSYGTGRATSRANRTSSSYSSYNTRNNLNKTLSNNELSSSTTSSSSSTTNANKENYPKPLFNEDDYTRITTPRQDVIFKKGYLSRPKPSYLSSTDTNTTSSATASIVSEESISTATSVPSSLSPEQCSSVHSDSIVDPEQAFMYSYIDQNGILYVNPFVPPPNGFDHYPPGQMFMMPYGYSPYNFCPPDLNTPSISDVDNEIIENEEISIKDIQKTKDETDENRELNTEDIEEISITETENGESKDNLSQNTENQDVDTTTINSNSIAEDDTESSKISSEIKDESVNTNHQHILTLDQNNQQPTKCYHHSYMRNNCDPNFFNYGYGGPQIYPPIYYPINYYGGPPIMPLMGPPPYEIHQEMINEELISNEEEEEEVVDGEDNSTLTKVEKIESTDSTITLKSNEIENSPSEEENTNLTEEMSTENEALQNLSEEEAVVETVKTEIVENAIQTSNTSNVESCDADDINLSITQETENKQQLNLNVNVDEFVPRTVTIKPHLNVNVKEFQPRYIKQNNNNITIKNPSLNHENKPILKLIINQEINQSCRSNELKKDLKTEKLSMQNLSINKNQHHENDDSAKENTNTNNTISESNQIQKSSQKPVTTLAEQIKRTLAIQNDNKIINTQPQTKVFQNSNSNQIKNVNVNHNKVEQNEIKSSNIKLNEKFSKSGKKSNNKAKNNRNTLSSNETSDKNNNYNKNKNLNNSIPKTSAESCNTVEEKEELLVIPTNLKKSSTTTAPPTTNNVLSYAQMLNKDLKAAEEKTNSIEQTNPTTNSTNPANSTDEKELDETEVQELIKSLETAEKLTAMKENICWQTVKSRGKRSKYHKEINNNNHEQEYTEIDTNTQEHEVSPVIEPVTIIPPKEDIENEKVSEINKDQNINNANDENQHNDEQIENGENSSAESSSMNKSIEKKKLKQKNKKTTKKSPNAKKSSPKEKSQKESESSNEGGTINKVKINLIDEELNIDKNMNVEDIDDNTLALKLYEDLEKELNMKIESDACDDDEEELDEKIIGKSPDLLMKHSSLGRNLDMINGFDYKFKTKNILKEEEEMVLNVIKSLSSNSSSTSPIGCNKKSDNIFNASFIALNGCSSQPSSVSAAFNNFENKKTLCEDPKNLIRKSSCSANTNVSTQSCGKSKQENNKIELNNTASGVDNVLNTVADKQHEDSNGIKTATVPTSPVKKDEANSEYIQNCIKESLKWIKKMESVEKTIDNIDEAQSSINEKVLNINKDKLDLSLYLAQQDKTKESEKASANDTALVQKPEKIKAEKSPDKGSGKSKTNRNKLEKNHTQKSKGETLTIKETLNHINEIDNTVTSEEQKHDTQSLTVEQVLLETETINNIEEIESKEKFVEKKTEDTTEPHILVEPTSLKHANEFESIPNESGDTNPNISLNFELNEKETEEVFETTYVPIEVTPNGDSQTSNEQEELNNQSEEVLTDIQPLVNEKEIQLDHLKEDEKEHINNEITLFKAAEVNEHLENKKQFNSDKIVTCSVDEENPKKESLICNESNSFIKTTTLEGKNDVQNGNIALTDNQLYHHLDAKTEEDNFENTLVEYGTENQIVDNDTIILHIETDSFQNGKSEQIEKETESQSTMVKLDTTISNNNEIIEESREIIAKELPTTIIVSDLMQNSFPDIENQLENKINGSKSIKDETSNGHEHQDLDFQLEKKLNSELLYNCHTTNENSNTLNGLNSFDQLAPSLKQNNNFHPPNGVRKECSSESDKNEHYQIEETDFGFVKEINKAEIPLYHNNLIFNRQRLSHSVSDSNDDNISLSGLEKHKSTSSLALQLQQLEEQLKKLDRLATPPLVHDETRNGFYNSENDFNSLESSETNSSTLEDSLTSPRNETMINDGYVSNSSGNEFHIYDPESTVCNIKINEPIVNDGVCVIDLDLNSSNSSNRNSKDCDSLNVTNLKNSDENCMKMFPIQSETNELQISVASQHDSEKFPLTFAVKNWLAQENKEKTPEPILRLPDDPNLHTRIKSSLSLHQLNDDDDNYYQEDDCWSVTTDSEVNFNEMVSENAEEDEDTETETEEQKIEILKNENKIKKSKNLKSNPLHVSSVKTTDNPNQYQLNKHQNDNDSDYNSDSQIPHIYDDNTCERVAAAPIKKNYKSDENISTTSSEQQIDYFWDDFVENPLKYLKNSKDMNNKNGYNNINNNYYNNNLRNTDITILDTSESMFSSGTSSMNELHDLTPYESVYGKSINYDKLLESNYELLSNNIINFNKTNCNYKKNGNLNNDNDHADDNYAEKNKKNILNEKFQKKNNSIAINNDNENDTSLNKDINLNNNDNKNNENCIKPPEVCCILM